MKIASAWSGHDCSFCVLEDGRPLIHDQLERFIREKEPAGDGIDFLFQNFSEYEDITHFATCHPYKKMTDHDESLSKMKKILEKNG